MKATDIIPEEILTSTVHDFLNRKEVPFTYGQWQVVDADEEIQRISNGHGVNEEIYLSSSFVYRDVESDYYYKVTLVYTAGGFLADREHKAVRVIRRMVPVYEEV